MSGQLQGPVTFHLEKLLGGLESRSDIRVVTNTSNNRITVLYSVYILSKESLCVPPSLLGNDSAKMFWKQRRSVDWESLQNKIWS